MCVSVDFAEVILLQGTHSCEHFCICMSYSMWYFQGGGQCGLKIWRIAKF